MSRNPAIRVPLLALFATMLVLALAGCGSTDVQQGSPSTTDGSDQGSGGEALDYPRGERDLVLRVEQSGGFLPVEAVFSTVPGFSLYGDGRVIYSGPIPEIFPGPALPNLLSIQLSDDGVQQLLQAARTAGLTQDQPDLGEPPVADASTTVFTLTVNDRTTVVNAYALGYEPEFSGGESAPGGSSGDTAVEEQGAPVFQLTDEQAEARRLLLDFQARLFDLRSWLGEEVGTEEPFEYEAVDVLSQPADPQAADPSGIEPNLQEWPLADLATLGEQEELGRRFVVQGDDLEELAPLLSQANALTLWQSEGGTYRLSFRPLLPDEVEAPARRGY